VIRAGRFDPRRRFLWRFKDLLQFAFESLAMMEQGLVAGGNEFLANNIPRWPAALGWNGALSRLS